MQHTDPTAFISSVTNHHKSMRKCSVNKGVGLSEQSCTACPEHIHSSTRITCKPLPAPCSMERGRWRRNATPCRDRHPVALEGNKPYCHKNLPSLQPFLKESTVNLACAMRREEHLWKTIQGRCAFTVTQEEHGVCTHQEAEEKKGKDHCFSQLETDKSCHA